MKTPKIAIIGLGYVGLPLAVEFAKKYQVVGFDINQPRVDELKQNKDHTLETSPEDLESVNLSSFEELKNNSTGLWLTTDLINSKS